MYVFIACACVMFGLFVYYFDMKTSRMKKITANIPRPKEYPFIGSMLALGFNPNDYLKNIMKISELGPITALWIGTQLYVLVNGVEEIKTLLTDPRILKKAVIYDHLEPWLGRGLLVSDGDEWHRQRKIITPAFHFKILENFINYFKSPIDTFVNILKNEVDKDGVKLDDYIPLATMDLVAESAMGVKIDAQIKKNNNFVKAIHDCCLIALNRFRTPWYNSDSIFYSFPIGKRFLRNIDIIHKLIDNVIIAKRKEKKNDGDKNKAENSNSDVGIKKRSAFLDLLLDYNLNDQEIKNQVNTFMFAGQDTTASTIGFIMYSLMKNPEVQEKVYQEQIEILGDGDKFPSYEDLKQMHYLQRVIYETLRLYPSVPVIGRCLTEDFKLNSECTLPRGSSIAIFLYHMHRNPKYFPNPDVFDPDRFLPENSVDRHTFSYLPFSAGSRNCIGQKFAICALKSFISVIVRKLKLIPPVNCPDIDINSNITLMSSTGVYVKIENRM